MAVMKTLNWLETQRAIYVVCMLSDSVSILRKVWTGDVYRQWLGLVCRLGCYYFHIYVCPCGSQEHWKSGQFGMHIYSAGSKAVALADIWNTAAKTGCTENSDCELDSASSPWLVELGRKEDVCQGQILLWEAARGWNCSLLHANGYTKDEIWAPAGNEDYPTTN